VVELKVEGSASTFSINV